MYSQSLETHAGHVAVRACSFGGERHYEANLPINLRVMAVN